MHADSDVTHSITGHLEVSNDQLYQTPYLIKTLLYFPRDRVLKMGRRNPVYDSITAKLCLLLRNSFHKSNMFYYTLQPMI